MALIDMMETFQMTNPGAHIDATDVYNSNDNLLDNAYFVGGGSQLGDGMFPINQRGQTSYSGASNTIDRWKTENSSISVGADVLTWTATGDNGQFEQIIENYKLIEGETYTATIDCDILAGSARLFVGGVAYPWPTVAGSTVTVSSGITKVTFTFSRESGYTGQYKLALASVGSCTAKLRKFKLEKGTYSTLANDVPPNFGEELAKCQRYLRAIYAKYGGTYIGVGMGISTNIYTIEFPFSMRATPTPSLSGTIDIDAPSGTHTVSSVAAQYSTTDTICLNFTVNGTVNVYEMGHFNIYGNARLLLSAEL